MTHLLALALLAATTARPASPLERIDRVEYWVDAAQRHVPGSFDDPAAVVAAWSNAELQALWPDLYVLAELLHHPDASYFTLNAPGSRRSVRIAFRPDQFQRLRTIANRTRDASGPDDVLRRGALLHADIAMNMGFAPQAIGSPSAFAPERVTVHIGDGQALDFGSTAIHWETARMLVDHTPRDDFARGWYAATSAWMQWHEDHDMDHIDHAAALFPDDPDLLFLRGCMHEVLASPAIQASVKSMQLPPGFSMNVGSPRAELKLAEQALRRAIDRRPSFAEAHLHHGRVLDLLGEHQAAANELALPAGSLDDDALEYFASLFLGGALEGAGRLDEARAAYDAAAARRADAQSPLLALAQLARRRGDRAAALAALDRLRALDEPLARDDPWWSYDVSHARNAADRLEALWAPFQPKADK